MGVRWDEGGKYENLHGLGKFLLLKELVSFGLQSVGHDDEQDTRLKWSDASRTQ